MALSKIQKSEVIGEIAELLGASKMTVIAQYQGTTVKQLQTLRRTAKESGTKVKVVKNRLVRQAILKNDALKDVDTSSLEGMLIYAFNEGDEVTPAKVLKAFAKDVPTIQFVGAISAEGKFLTADEVKTLADMPSRDELIAQVVATLLSPVNDVTNALSGNLHALLDGVSAKAAA